MSEKEIPKEEKSTTEETVSPILTKEFVSAIVNDVRRKKEIAFPAGDRDFEVYVRASVVFCIDGKCETATVVEQVVDPVRRMTEEEQKQAAAEDEGKEE